MATVSPDVPSITSLLILELPYLALFFTAVFK